MDKHSIIRATEYFCPNCGQLRLNMARSQTCANCGCPDIIHDEVGRLNKDELLELWKKGEAFSKGKDFNLLFGTPYDPVTGHFLSGPLKNANVLKEGDSSE